MTGSESESAETVAALVRGRAGDPNLGLQFEGRRWTWAEVEAEMEVRAAFLEDLLPDDPGHVGVLLDNVPEYLFLLGGAALAGRVVVGINPTRRGEELARDIRHADCQAVITDATYAGSARRARSGAGHRPGDRRRHARSTTPRWTGSAGRTRPPSGPSPPPRTCWCSSSPPARPAPPRRSG